MFGRFKSLFSRDLFTVAILLCVLVIIIVPLPKGVLDFFLTISLTFSMLILLISIYIQKPSDLTTFPTLILILALFRLALNVATTRSILSDGHNGPEYVSSIIASFGEFVVGGNLIIGLVVFIILVLINFMVITKGAGRVAEVSARFSLDSLPGKQMAIDADLNAGFITDEEARVQRDAVISEANFYGAMDGSSKFVKGDAIAGIIITIVNIIAGLLIGIFQHDLPASQSAEIYTILTIGDGLVSQMPALVLSTATAIIITRSSRDDENFAVQSVNQLINEYKALFIVGMIVVSFGFLPGFPTTTLVVIGIILMLLGYIFFKTSNEEYNALTKFFGQNGPSSEDKIKSQIDTKPKVQEQSEEEQIDSIMKMEILELKLGYQLLSLLQGNNELLDKIKGIRKTIAAEFGFIIPQIRIKDDINLEPNEYKVYMKRIPLANGNIQTSNLLAMGGFANANLPGQKIKEPIFGLDAIWIDPSQKDDAVMKGFTVVDPATIISTHISELIKQTIEDIITRQDIVNIVDKLKDDFPTVVEDVLKTTSYGTILGVCKSLLHEKIPIVDMLTIIETIADLAEYTKNTEVITEHVRSKLYRLITQKYKNSDGTLKVITLKPETEQDFLGKLKEENGLSQIHLTIAQINSLVEQTNKLKATIVERGVEQVVLIVDPSLRKRLAEIYDKFGVDIAVLSHAELDSSASFSIEGSIEA
jgi:flagellar biosynthesis protein FlhA